MHAQKDTKGGYMKIKYEHIQYNDNLPARIEIIDKPTTAPHWHEEMELIYVIEGVVNIGSRGSGYQLNEGDVMLINSDEIHHVYSEAKARYLSLHLSYSFAKQFDPRLETATFEINADAQEKLRPLLQELAVCHGEENRTFKDYACLMDIFHILFTDCRRSKKHRMYRSDKTADCNARIAVDYIELHYRENLSRDIMASVLGLHPVYFSQYFKRVTGMGFHSYVNTVRMKHALNDLIYRNYSISAAAQENGFANLKSFETACKRSYGLTPLRLKKMRTKTNETKEKTERG